MRKKLESAKAFIVLHGTDRKTSGFIQTHLSFCKNIYIFIINVFLRWHQSMITNKSL